MDTKQFNLFQEVVQFAVDERRKPRHKSRFKMSSWFELPERNGVTTKKARETMIEKLDLSVPGYHDDWVALKQDVNFCGTTACLAGTALIMYGEDRFIFQDELDYDGDYVLTKDGKVKEISDRAYEVLGFTGNDHELFYMTSQSIDEIVARATQIAAKHGHKLEII